jgi:hypothetical protein
MTTLLCVALLGTFGPAQVQVEKKAPPTPLDTGEMPVGILGERLGEYLTIEGVRNDGMKTERHSLLVYTVNGIPLAKRTPIWVENLELPSEKRIVLKGYENGRMIGIPPAQELAAKEQGRLFENPVQTFWQWQPYFVALIPVEPKGLKLLPIKAID